MVSTDEKADRLLPIQGVRALREIVTAAALNKWAATGVIPGCKKYGRRWFASESAIKRFLAEGGGCPPQIERQVQSPQI
jgi:hypothetical protein